VSLAKKPSTALSHEHDVGVKWKVKRWCRSSHWRTFDGVISIEMPVRIPHCRTPQRQRESPHGLNRQVLSNSYRCARNKFFATWPMKINPKGKPT